MECDKMVELKPRSASAGKFAGKIRHNQEALFDDEYKQLVAITKTEDKEEQLMFIFKLLKIEPSKDRATKTATADKSKVAEYVAKLDKYISDCEATNPELKIDETFVKKLLSKCSDKLMKEALEKHYFKVAVVEKVAEFTF
jgi:hypothetical protein